LENAQRASVQERGKVSFIFSSFLKYRRDKLKKNF
jgi:hypothetical protein